MKPYLYIIIGIVWLVYNMYKNMQKKQINNPEGLPTEPEKDTDIKTILEEILMGKQKMAPKPILSVPKDKPVEKYGERSLEPGARSQKPGVSNPISGLRSPVSKFEEEENVKTIDFDIRQAIIFSEILKRPQYQKLQITDCKL